MQTRQFLKNKKGHILILYGDVPNIKASTLQPIINDHTTNNRDLTLITAEIDNPIGYGRIIRDKNGDLLRIIEEKDCTSDERKIKEWNPGIYIFKIPEVFDILNKIKTNNASNEYYLTDAIGLAQQSNMQIKAIKIANSNEVIGINTAVQLKELES